jgi:hypothetical protein
MCEWDEDENRSDKRTDRGVLYVRTHTCGKACKGMSKNRAAKPFRVLLYISEEGEGLIRCVSDARRHWTETNG